MRDRPGSATGQDCALRAAQLAVEEPVGERDRRPRGVRGARAGCATAGGYPDPHARAAAERLGIPLDEIARRIAVRHHLDPPNDGGPR